MADKEDTKQRFSGITELVFPREPMPIYTMGGLHKEIAQERICEITKSIYRIYGCCGSYQKEIEQLLSAVRTFVDEVNKKEKQKNDNQETTK